MNLADLQHLVARGESDQLEFKRTSGETKEAVKAVCGMLNSLGGFVVIGADDHGTLVGQQVRTTTIASIVQELRRIEPPAFPDVETVPIRDDLSAVVLRVSGGGGPYSYDGRPYMRHGPTTQVMPRDRYERMLLERMHASQRWENQAAEGIALDDLDPNEIRVTLEEGIRRGRMEDPGTRDSQAILTGLGCMHQGQVLNAAVVLFARADRLLSRYPQCLVRLARFRGIDKSEFLDNRQEVGNAFDLFIRAQRFLRDHLPVAGRIVPNLFERIDDPLYPPEALREALANALCHRDYSIAGGAVSLALYEDRLEISSTGLLPFGLTPADLLEPHQSRPWNPIIAQVFYRRGLIESWGRGTIKMAELAEQAGLAAPEFEVHAGEVVVRFRPTAYVPPTRVSHDLSALQRELLAIVAETGPASLSEVRARLKTPVAPRTLQDNLQILRQLGLVSLSGTTRSARWSLAAPS